ERAGDVERAVSLGELAIGQEAIEQDQASAADEIARLLVDEAPESRREAPAEEKPIRLAEARRAEAGDQLRHGLALVERSEQSQVPSFLRDAEHLARLARGDPLRLRHRITDDPRARNPVGFARARVLEVEKVHEVEAGPGRPRIRHPIGELLEGV